MALSIGSILKCSVNVCKTIITAAFVSQHCQMPAVIVDGVSGADVTSPRQSLNRCVVRDTCPYAADVTYHDAGRVLLIQDHDVCRIKRLSVNYQVSIAFYVPKYYAPYLTSY